jgi:hypothetical protein
MSPPLWAFAAAALVCGVVTSLVWSLRAIRMGVRDSSDLAAKVAVPHPRRAADWPEIRLDAVVPDPESVERVLVVARWPAHPEARALLVLEVDDPTTRTHGLLMLWRDVDASLFPRTQAGTRLVLRRRRTRDAVNVRVLEETACTSTTGRWQ